MHQGFSFQKHSIPQTKPFISPLPQLLKAPHVDSIGLEQTRPLHFFLIQWTRLDCRISPHSPQIKPSYPNHQCTTVCTCSITLLQAKQLHTEHTFPVLYWGSRTVGTRKTTARHRTPIFITSRMASTFQGGLFHCNKLLSSDVENSICQRLLQEMAATVPSAIIRVS